MTNWNISDHDAIHSLDESSNSLPNPHLPIVGCSDWIFLKNPEDMLSPSVQNKGNQVNCC